MAKQIRRSEISEEDLFKNIRESALDTIKILSKFDAELKKVAATAKGDLGAKGDSSAEIKKKTAAMNQANKAKKASIQIDKQMAQARKQVVNSEIQLEKIKREKLKTEREELRNAQAKAKASERTARAVENERNAYKRLVVETRNQKNESKRLAARLIELEAAGKKNTRGFRDLQRQYKEVTRAAQKGDVQLKKIDKTVGDNFRNVGNYTGAISKLRNGLAQLGLAFGAFRLIRDSFNTIKEFEQGQADLASVLGVSTSEMTDLTEQAKELGATTTFTATQVLELQKELAKLGFTQSQIQDMTGATLLLAEATGTELARAAEVTGATLRGFGLEADETQRVVDVMAKSFSASSLDMEKFSTAMATVAPVAAQLGFSVEETTGLIGTLTDRGIDASTAGTALRNIFLDAGKQGLTFEQALAEINASADKTGKAFELFGKRGATVATILAENQDAAASLTGQLKLQNDEITEADFFAQLEESGMSFNEAMKEIEKSSDKSGTATELFGAELSAIAVKLQQSGANAENFTQKLDEQRDAAKKMADTQRNTLGGALALLKSAWDGFILKMNEAGGVGESLRTVIQFLAKNLETILTWVGRLIKVWAIYRIATSKVTKNLLDFSKAVGASVKNLRAQGVSLNNAKKGFSGATSGAKAFGKAIKGIAFAAAISLAIEFIGKLWDIVSGADAAADALARMNKQMEAGRAAAQERSDARQKELDKNIRALERARDEELAGAKSKKERDAIELKFLKDRGKLLENNQKVVKEDITKVEGRKRDSEKKLENHLKKVKKFLKDNNVENASFNDLITDPALTTKYASLQDKLQGMAETTRQIKANIAGQNERIKVYNAELEGTGEHLRDNTSEQKIQNTEAGKQQGTQVKINTQLQFQIDLQKELRDIENERLSNQLEYNEILRDRATTQLTRDIDELKESTLDLIKAQGLQVGFDEFGNVFAIAEKGVEIDKVTTKAIAQYNQLNKLIDERAQLEKDSITATRDFEIEEQKRAFRERFADLRAELEAEEIELLSQEGLVPDSAEFNEIKRQVEKQRKNINDLEIAQFEKLKEDIKIIEEDAQNGLINAENERLDIKKELDEQILKANEDFNNKKIKQDADALKKQQEQEKKAAEARIAIVQALTEKAIEASNKRIEKLDEEISNAKTQQDFFRKLAAEGNIAAQQSLAEQAEIEREARIQREKELKQQARIQLASSAYSTYQSKVAAGSDKPLAETIRDISFLQAFIQNIPLFEEGTEDTGANGQGVDGRGGFHAILHPNERVMTKEQNKMVGAMSNIELAQLAQEYNAGKIVRQGEGAIQIGNNWNSAAILAKLNELNETVKNKPEIDYKVEEIIAGMMKIRKSEKRGNTIIHNKYRLK